MQAPVGYIEERDSAQVGYQEVSVRVADVLASVVPEGAQRIEAGRSQRGKDRGSGGSRQECNHRDAEYERVIGLQAEQLTLHVTTTVVCGGDASRQAAQHDGDHLARYQTDDDSAACTQGHADADLVRP